MPKPSRVLPTPGEGSWCTWPSYRRASSSRIQPRAHRTDHRLPPRGRNQPLRGMACGATRSEAPATRPAWVQICRDTPIQRTMRWFPLVLAVLLLQAAAISLSPHSGRPGDPFIVTGNGFVPNDRVRILWDGSNLGRPAKVDPDGSFTYSGAVPTGASPGSHTLTAQGRDSGIISAAFTVESASTSTTTATTTTTIQTTTNSNTGAPTTTAARSSAAPSTSEIVPPPTTTPTTITTTTVAVVGAPEVSTAPTAAGATSNIARRDTEPSHGAGGFLSLLAVLAALVGGVTVWVWHRGESDDDPDKLIAEPPLSKKVSAPPRPAPSVSGEAAGWTRREMQLRPAGEVNGLIDFLDGLLAFGAETGADPEEPGRAALWRSHGTEWTGQTTLVAGAVEFGVSWGKGLLLLGSQRGPDGYSACTWWSVDGQQWDRLTSPGDPTLRGVAFDGIAVGDATLVTYGRGHDGPGIWTSRDATTWRQSPLRGVIDLVSAVPGGFVTFGHHPDKRRPIVATSDDGVSWDTLPAEALFAFEGISMAALATFDGGLVAAGTDRLRGSATVWVSDTGTQWLRAPFEAQPGTSIEHLRVVEGRLVAVGSDMGPQRTGRPGAVPIWVSSDAVTWERLESGDLFDNALARSVISAGDSLIIFGTLVAGYESPWPDHIPVIWTREGSVVPVGSEATLVNP